MTKRERLEAALDLRKPDRPPILGGWLSAPGHIQALTGCSDDAYWEDRVGWALAAERVLDSDGIVETFVPRKRGDYRCVDHALFELRHQHTEESVLAFIEKLNSPERTKAGFDEEAAYPEFARNVNDWNARCGDDLVWCGADWEIIPRALSVNKFGYEAALMTMATHPDAWRRMMQVTAEWARAESVLVARTIREGLRPKAVLTGEDICTQRGPMASPAFLRREFWPLLEYAIEPLVACGAKVIWHCDGDVRPLLDDLLATGVAGLQGFQRECGVELEQIVKRRTRTGDPLIIFGPMSVTTTLPLGSTADVRAEVRRAMDVCRDEASLVFLTSNTINPDCPLDNIRAYWDEVRNSRW